VTRPLHWAAFCAALIGVSCAGPQPAPESPPPAPKETAEPAPAAPETPAPGALAARPPAKPEPPPPQVKPADLIGLTDAELAKVLGMPAFKRVDDPAALWQYRGTRCILDLFLYADGSAYRVTHLELRSRPAGQAAGTPLRDREAARCFADLLPDKTVEG
jgi:hypothetical protein